MSVSGTLHVVTVSTATETIIWLTIQECWLVHGPILILVPIRGTKDDCCELIAHKVEIENLYDNLSVGVAFKIFFSRKSAGNDL